MTDPAYEVPRPLDELAAAEARLAEALAENTKLVNAMDEMGVEVHSLKEAVKGAKARTEQVEQQLVTSRAYWERRLHSCQQSWAEMKAERDQARHMEQHWRVEQQTADAKWKELQGTVDSLRGQLAESEKQLKLERERVQAAMHVAETEADAGHAFERQLAEARAEAEDLRQRARNATKSGIWAWKRDDLRDYIEQLEAARVQAEGAAAAMREALIRLREYAESLEPLHRARGDVPIRAFPDLPAKLEGALASNAGKEILEQRDLLKEVVTDLLYVIRGKQLEKVEQHLGEKIKKAMGNSRTLHLDADEEEKHA